MGLDIIMISIKISDETQKSYKEAFPKFVEKFDLKDLI